jgi:hypothetical protein
LDPSVEAIKLVRLHTDLDLQSGATCGPPSLFWYHFILRAHQSRGTKNSGRKEAPTSPDPDPELTMELVMPKANNAFTTAHAYLQAPEINPREAAAMTRELLARIFPNWRDDSAAGAVTDVPRRGPAPSSAQVLEAA